MAEDPFVALLGEALRNLVRFVEERSEHATPDDDVKALEDTVYVLNQVAPEQHDRLRALLGEEIYFWVFGPPEE